MELKQLRYFLAVVKTGSFYKAAEQMNVTQQAVSRSMQQLETECGGRLLTRKKGDRRMVSPTYFGTMLIPRAERVLADLDDFRNELEHLGGTGHLRVRLGATPTVARTLMPRIIHTFCDSHPGSRVQVVQQTNHVIVEHLSSGLYDVAICDKPEENLPPNLVAEALYTDRNVFVAGKDHPLVKRDSLALKDLDGVSWVMLGAFCRLWNEFRDLHVAEDLAPPWCQLETNSVELALRYVAEYQFLSFLPLRLVQDDIASGRLARLPVLQPRPREWQCLLITRSDRSLSVVTRTFIDSARAAARQLGPP